MWRFPSVTAALHTHTGEPSSTPDAEAGPGGLAPADAAEWRLVALGTSYERDTGPRGFVLRAGEWVVPAGSACLPAAPRRPRVATSCFSQLRSQLQNCRRVVEWQRRRGGSNHSSHPLPRPLLLAVDKPRRFLRLQSLAGGAAQHILAGSAEVAPELLPSDSSFSGMLLKLADSAK